MALIWVNYPAAQPALRPCDRVGQVHLAGHHQLRLVFHPLLGLLELLRLPVARQGPREGVLRPGRRDEEAGPESGLRLRPGHVGVRTRARPDGHARRPHAAALLDQRLHRVARKGCTTSRRPPRPTTSSTPPSCPTSPRTRCGASTTRPARTWPKGIQHLQMLGVKYFMAETPDIEAAADADSNLQLVATVGPFPVTYTTGSTVTRSQQRTWKIYEVADSAEVAPLVYQPVVMTGVSQGRQDRGSPPRSRGISTPAGGTSTRPPRAPRTGPGSPPTRHHPAPNPAAAGAGVRTSTRAPSPSPSTSTRPGCRCWSRRRTSPTGR